MSESILVVIGLGLIAGGGIIVLDALVIRQVRRIAASSDALDGPRPDREDGT